MANKLVEPITRDNERDLTVCRADHAQAEKEAAVAAAYEDAQAALEAAEREARNEAAEAADKLGHHCIGCGHLCGDPEKDLRLLRKAGAKACCPERKMEPLSAAILALMEDTDDE